MWHLRSQAELRTFVFCPSVDFSLMKVACLFHCCFNAASLHGRRGENFWEMLRPSRFSCIDVVGYHIGSEESMQLWMGDFYEWNFRDWFLRQPFAAYSLRLSVAVLNSASWMTFGGCWTKPTPAAKLTSLNLHFHLGYYHVSFIKDTCNRVFWWRWLFEFEFSAESSFERAACIMWSFVTVRRLKMCHLFCKIPKR
jgi:hypothetical protein